jgi:putative tricarboxylic transport membrane protein
MPESSRPSAGDRKERFGLEFGAGLFLVLIAAIGVFGSLNLAFGQMSGIGPGFMPRVTALIVGAFGIFLIVQSLLMGSQPLEPWSVRGIVLVLGAIVAFGYMIRPFGLAVAGPVAILIAAMADPATRPREIIPFAILLTLASVALFKYMLRLPIPLAPPLLGY